MEAYIRFLYHVGEQSLPDAFIWIYKKSEAYDPKKLFRNSNTRYGLEVLLQRYVYSKPLLLKERAALREAVLALLDALIDLGSSAAFRMRADFVTPHQRLASSTGSERSVPLALCRTLLFNSRWLSSWLR
jgi:hypothetical protein